MSAFDMIIININIRVVNNTRRGVFSNNVHFGRDFNVKQKITKNSSKQRTFSRSS